MFVCWKETKGMLKLMELQHTWPNIQIPFEFFDCHERKNVVCWQTSACEHGSASVNINASPAGQYLWVWICVIWPQQSASTVSCNVPVLPDERLLILDTYTAVINMPVQRQRWAFFFFSLHPTHAVRTLRCLSAFCLKCYGAKWKLMELWKWNRPTAYTIQNDYNILYKR